MDMLRKTLRESYEEMGMDSDHQSNQYNQDNTDAGDLQSVKEDPSMIELIDNPSKEVQLQAVKNWPYALEKIQIQDPHVCIASVKRYPESIKFVKPEIRQDPTFKRWLDEFLAMFK